MNNELIDSEFPASVSAGPEPLQTFEHPEHGTLAIYGFDARSRLCRKADGTEVRIGTRVVNRLMSGRLVTPPSSRTVRTQELRVSAETVAEQLPEMVTVTLSQLPDTSERVRIAREIWAAADAFLST